MPGLFAQIDCSLLNQPKWRILTMESRLFYIQLLAWAVEQCSGEFKVSQFQDQDLSDQVLGLGIDIDTYSTWPIILALHESDLIDMEEGSETFAIHGFDERYESMIEQKRHARERAQRVRDKKRDVTQSSQRDVRERNGTDVDVDVDVESYVEQPAESKPPSKETQDPVKGLSLYEQDAKLLKAWPKLYSTWLHLADGNSAWIDQQITAAHSWEIANPKRRKKDRPRFLNGWITRNWASRQATGPPSRELPLYTSSDTEGTS